MSKQIDKEVEKSFKIINDGGIILYPTETIWGIGCDATKTLSIEKLFNIKKRSMEESRADDSFFEKRLQIYKKSHLEILNSLKKNYSVIDIQANDEISSVTAKIVEKLGLN